MIKLELKRKDIKNFEKVFSVGYCELQEILTNPPYYNAGVNGWNCDVFALGECQDILLTTGYRTYGKALSAGIIKKYQERIKKANKKEITKRYQSLKRIQKQFFKDVEKLAK